MLEDRWFRPSFCGHGSVSDHILCMLHNLFELAVGFDVNSCWACLYFF